VRIILEQSYDGFEQITTPYRQRRFTELVESNVERLFNFAGLEVVPPNSGIPDAVMTIRLRGRALGEKYSDGNYYYSGASITGNISLKALDNPEEKTSFAGKIDPPPSLMLMKKAKEAYSQPSEAPFDKALRNSTFGRKIIDLMHDSFGIGFLTASLLFHETYGFIVKDISNKWLSLGAAALDPLTDTMINGKKSRVRKRAAEILGLIGDTRAVPALIKTLQDEDRYVRIAAAAALGKTKDSRAVIYLMKIVEKMKWKESNTAAQALQSIRDPRSISSMVTALKDISQGKIISGPDFVHSDHLKSDTRILEIKAKEIIMDFGVQSLEFIIAALVEGNEIFQTKAFQILREITKADVPNNVKDWEKWWQGNRHRYEKEGI